jgi:hypothetical protein
MNDADREETREQLAEHVRLHPETSAIEAVASVGADPAVWVDVVEAALARDDPAAEVREADVEAPRAEESDETAETAEEEPRGDGSPAADPQGETDETGDELDKYRRVYLDAVDRAGREPWEPVEEAALREALAAIGFEELLDDGTLFDVRPWRFVDVSSDDEEPRRRWYYPSGDEPRTDEFRRFDELLRAAAPGDYKPHYFRVAKASKDPATQYGSWKTEEARLTTEEAVEWMERGGNVGIAGRPEDPLINVDIDDDEETTPDDVPTSLRARSRSRTGWHTWYFDEDGDVPNIPTDEYGEVRTNWQYVVAPGSFVASCREEIPEGADRPGYYTVEDEEPVVSIEYEDLPEVFRDFAAEVEAAEEEADEGTEPDEEIDVDARDFDLDDDGSAVFDVEAADLVSATHDDADRFSSIFHGSGTGANMSVSGDKVHCWRHGVAHGGLQALATLSDVDHVRTYGCGDLGAAHKNSGAGSNRLKGDWRLVWGAWHEAKDRGAIPDDDPIPYRALRELAVADDLVDSDDLVERDVDTGEVASDDAEETYLALPAGTYNDVLEHVETEYGVDPGREPVGGSDANAEAVAPLALEKLDALGADDRERAARKRGAEIPSTRDARERLRNAILRELRGENSTVLDAPTALGKSHTVATEPWRRRDSTTGGAPVVHLHQTREARDEAARATGASSATGDVLLGRKEASPLARGDHDPVADADSEAAPDVVVTIDGEPASEWFDRQCDEKGLPFSTALAIARDRNDQGLDELPPFGEEDPAVAQWDGLPRDDDGEPAVDVLHATHQFAHVPSLRTHTNVVLDEQPDFTLDVGQDRIRRMITAFLRAVDAPVTTFEAFVTLARGTSTGGDAAAERDHLDELLGSDHGLDAEWFIDEPDAHAIAPDLARAVWNALRWEDADKNGRHATKVVHEPPRFDAEKEGFAARTILSVVIDEENTVRRLRSTPDFSQTRSVIGLDAHPSMPLWELNADAGMTYDEVLDAEERRLWRRYERGLTVVQVGDATRPRSGPNATEWMNDDRVRAVLESLREQYGSGFKTALSTVQTEARLRSLLADVAGDGVDAENTLHFGEEKSRNDFADEDAGYVYGCMDPGDDMVLDALAELGLEAEPERAETDAGDVVRAKGRGFDGPDADTAAAVLASVRENHVAQAAGRYARNADDPDSRATVYVHTDAAPEGFVDYETPGVEWLATDLQRDVIDALTTRRDATAKEIADDVGCSKEHVRETLGRLEEKDLVDRTEGAGRYGADVYRDEGAEPRQVDLGETANDRLMDLSRWSLAIDDRHAREDVDAGADAEPSTAAGGVTAGDPPDR